MEEEEKKGGGSTASRAHVASVEQDPLYDRIVTCNRLLAEIKDEIVAVHQFVSKAYSKKLPELSGLLPNVGDYVAVVKRIGNETVGMRGRGR